MKLLITGGSGYVGAMLAEQFSKRSDVEKILAIDKEPASELYAGNQKVDFIQVNISDDSWQDRARAFAPDVVIHTAWQIREMYGQKKKQWLWNVTGSEKVFDFAFSTPSVKKLIHFSTVASYSARPDNTIEHRFTEAEPFRLSDYLYAEEKRIAEEKLQERFAAAKAKGPVPQVFVVRPAAITGPRGRYSRIRFGLQSALSGQLKANPLHRLISAMVSFVPATPKWCRQFIHEDDVNDIIARLAFEPVKDAQGAPASFEIFNICPPGPAVLAPDMAQAVGKKVLPLQPWMIRPVFFIFWHLSRGRVPTSKGGWKSYSYPIVVDGSKVTKLLGYSYKYQPKEAFVKKEGRYAGAIPQNAK